jgi:hypothetical protein
MTDDTVMHDAIGKIREASDKRREVEARVLAENNLASVRQLSEDKKKKFCAIVDALLAEQADVNVQLFPENDSDLIAAAGQIKTTTWGTITESSEDLQELSKDTLKSYRGKAHKDIGRRIIKTADTTQTDWKSASKDKTKVAKRVVGMNRASVRLNKEEIAEAILEQEGLHIDQLTESGLAKLDAIVEQIMIDEGVLATGIAAGLGASAAHKIMKNKNFGKKAVRAVAGKSMAHDRASKVGAQAYSAQNKAFASGTGEAERNKLLARSKPRMKAYQKYSAISNGQKAAGGFGTRKEEIIETILAMEGLHSIDQLTESGLAKMEAIVEQVMMDEEDRVIAQKSPAGLQRRMAQRMMMMMKKEDKKFEPRGERDVGDAKQPRGVPNKSVDKATLADRKLVKKNGGRFPDNNSY